MKNLKLSSLAQNALSEREMNAYVGGEARCGCACRNNNTLDNLCANSDAGIFTPGASKEEMVMTIEPAVVTA